MYSKKTRQEPVTLATLSPSSIYHLRAACAILADYETFSVEDEVEVVFEKVIHQSSSNFGNG
jgi:hypothetical protein